MKEAPIDYETLWGEDEPEPSAKPDRNFFDEHQAICDCRKDYNTHGSENLKPPA